MPDREVLASGAPIPFWTCAIGVFYLIGMRDRICTAIEARRLLAFDYEGWPRTVEPHAHGESPDGNELLRAFQVLSSAEAAALLGWALFRVEAISGINVLDATFAGPRPDYHRDDPAIRKIFCQL